MNQLLDTNIIILFANGDINLPNKVREIIANPINQNFCSTISFWEIAIKTNIGKLEFNKPLEQLEFFVE